METKFVHKTPHKVLCAQCASMEATILYEQEVKNGVIISAACERCFKMVEGQTSITQIGSVMKTD